jgi:phenylacetate-CoA ligase
VTTPVELSIIVPCYNEGENVLELAERSRAVFEARGIAGEVVFVDDASTDNTGPLIDELASRCDFVRAVHHTRNRGIPGGWESGAAAARGRYVAIMDGDLQYLPEDVYRMYRELRYTNADIVQGWRSHIGRARDFRYLMSRVLHHILRLLFGMRLSDIKSGFLVCDRDIFIDILRRRFSYHYFQTFIAISAHHKGYRIAEIESLFEERKLGESFISAFPIKMIGKNLVDVAKGLVEFRLLSARTNTLHDALARHPTVPAPAPLPLLRRLHLRLFAILMPLHHWKLSNTALRYYDELRRTQWLSAGQIRELQEARLRALITHAYRHVAYYRELFDRLGIDPGQIQGLQDLERLPTLSTDTIRRSLHFDLLSDAHDKMQMLPVTTSGASGEPLVVYVDKTQLEMRWAATVRNQEWTGYRFGDRHARLRYGPVGTSRLQAMRDRLDGLLARRAEFTTDVMNADTVRDWVEFVRQYRPTVIEGDAEMLQWMAAQMARQSLHLVPPRGVVTSEQTLTPESRAAIERAFDAPVFDRYGSRLFSAVACECEVHHGQHVNAESYIVEIVRDGRTARPGEIGEVLITDLTNLSVPLIRYATGDRATATDRGCPCGRGLPLIDALDGRPQSIFAGNDDCVVPGTFFAELFRDYGHIVKQYRMAQRRPGAVDLHVVKGARFSDARLQDLLAAASRRLGGTVRIDLQVVEPIASLPGETLTPDASMPRPSAAGLD